MPQHANPDKRSHPCNIINTLLLIISNKNLPNPADQNTKILRYLLSMLHTIVFLYLRAYLISTKLITYYI